MNSEKNANLVDEESLAYAVSPRTKICIWIIALGLLNFLAYTLAYLQLGGDAMNGYVRLEPVKNLAGGAERWVRHYYLCAEGRSIQVGRGAWIFSAVHAISIWITVGAVLLAMLTLAKDQIISSMRSSIVRGRTFITILATIVTLISVSVTIWFVIHMVHQLVDPAKAGPA